MENSMEVPQKIKIGLPYDLAISLLGIFPKEMQIKTKMRCPLTQFRMAIIKKCTHNKCWRGCGEKGTVLHCWWECKLIESLWRTFGGFLQTKIELPYDPAIPLLGIYPEQTIIQKESCTTMFIAALFTISRTWNQA